MRHDCKRGGSLGMLLACAVAMWAGLQHPAAGAQDAAGAKSQRATQVARTTPAAQHPSAQKAAQRYFIEFRSRTAVSYGHAFVVFGKLDAQGRIVESEISGLHPATDSSIPYALGHLIPVPAETGPSFGDDDEQYVTARYRILLNEAEYNQVVAYIREKQANSPVWHAVLYSCVTFIKDIAQSMGLRTPRTSVIYPETFVNDLREMNEGAEHQTAAPPHAQSGLASAPSELPRAPSELRPAPSELPPTPWQ